MKNCNTHRHTQEQTAQEHAHFYTERNWSVVPVLHQGKVPSFPNGKNRSDWQKLTATHENIHELFTGAASNIGLHLNGDMVDIDLDCDEAIRLAYVFLPPTLTFGRHSAPDSHWLYKAQPEFKQFKRAKRGDEDGDKCMLVEIRHGAGKQSVIPPSVHKSGEQIDWTGSPIPSPAVVDANELTRAVSRLAACSLICQYWATGSRDDLACTAANLMHRAGIDEGEIELALEAITSYHGDEEASGRIAKVRRAVAADGAGFGIPKLKELVGEADAAKIVEWLGLNRESEIDWEEPIELDQLTAPPWDENFLPGAFGKWSEDVAERQQSHVEFPAVALTTSVATAAGAGVRVQPKRHDTQFLLHACLWSCVVAPSGTMKTPGINEGLGPLFQIRKEIHNQHKARLADWRESRDRYREATPTERREQNIPEPGPEPMSQSIVINDATVEAMAHAMLNSPFGFLYQKDELSGLVKAFNKYRDKGQGGDMEFLMEAFSGGAVDVKRRGPGGSIFVPYACVSILGTIQPAVVRDIFSSESRAENGFTARFGLFLYPEKIEQGYVDKEPDLDSLHAITDQLRAIRQTFDPATPTTFKLDGAAYVAFKDFCLWLAEEIERTPNPLKEHLAKYRGTVAQLALCRHLMQIPIVDGQLDIDEGCDGASIPRNVEISGDDMTAAIDLLKRVLLPHARKVYGLVTSRPAEADARKILGWLKRKAVSEFTMRDLLRGNRWTQGLEQRDLIDALRLLEDYGWLVAKSTRFVDESKGRPTLKYKVNPLIVDK